MMPRISAEVQADTQFQATLFQREGKSLRSVLAVAGETRKTDVKLLAQIAASFNKANLGMTRLNAVACATLLLVPCGAQPHAAGVKLVQEGRARATIYAAADIFENPARERLRASVRDLAHYLSKMSGADIQIVRGRPTPGAPLLPILVGKLAEATFEQPKTTAPARQGFRVVVTQSAVGLLGHSDLATSYAIYEVLDQLGCRWYMPSSMGEVIPRRRTITLKEQDLDAAPYTFTRTVWHADRDYRRRNRLGGRQLNTGHALEGYVSADLLAQHPEWRAVYSDGQSYNRRLKFSHPGVAEAIADHIIERLESNPQYDTVSLSPDDGPANGLGFDMTDDLKLDAGDWDPTIPGPSHTDRLVWFCNRIAERVTAKHPHVLFGMLAYRNYTRPPVREKLHPRIVPQIAALSYSRAHPWTDPSEPNNEAMRHIVRGWGAAAQAVSYYMYGYFWPELSTPNPFITKWSKNVPLALGEGKCKFWQPETLPNFDTTMHALYLGIRLAWDPQQNPRDIIDRLHRDFYGHAAEEMAAYWHFVDSCWVSTPEYSGGGYGHLRRFTRERMATARRLMDRALAAVRSPPERFRVVMADDSLRLFELFMKMRRDLAAGHFSALGRDAHRWRATASALAERYRAQFAFGRIPWDGGNSIYGRLFRKLYQATYEDAARIAERYDILTNPPLRSWRFRVDPADHGITEGWATLDFDDDDWRLSDICLETMSTLGHHDYRGSMWHRTKVTLPALAPQRKIYLWVGGAFDEAQPFVNGRAFDKFRSRGEPLSFDITDVVRRGEVNQLAIRCIRGKGRLGLGGLVAPVVIYAARP